jgi:hypothetical protein
MHIDEYRHGRMVIDGRVQTKDLIVTRHGIRPNWWRDEGHTVTTEDLEVVLGDPPDVLIVGTGSAGRMQPTADVERVAQEAGIDLEVMPTAEAVERFNEVVGLGDVDVAAAFHLTC